MVPGETLDIAIRGWLCCFGYQSVSDVPRGATGDVAVDRIGGSRHSRSVCPSRPAMTGRSVPQ